MIYIVGKSRLGMRIAASFKRKGISFSLVSRSTGAEYTREWFQKNLKRAKAVIFSAGRVSSSPSELEREHVKPLEELASTVDCRIVLASSISVYGKNAHLITDGTPPKPDTPYAKAKLKQEEVLEGRNAAMLRLGVLYGEEYPAYMKMLSLIEKGIALILGSGKNNIPFTYVGSAASFFSNAVLADFKGPLNVAGKGSTQREAIEIAASLMSAKPLYVNIPVSLALAMGKIIPGTPFSSSEEILSISADRRVISKKAESHGFKDIFIERGIKRVVSHYIKEKRRKRKEGTHVNKD